MHTVLIIGLAERLSVKHLVIINKDLSFKKVNLTVAYNYEYLMLNYEYLM